MTALDIKELCSSVEGAFLMRTFCGVGYAQAQYPISLVLPSFLEWAFFLFILFLESTHCERTAPASSGGLLPYTEARARGFGVAVQLELHPSPRAAMGPGRFAVAVTRRTP